MGVEEVPDGNTLREKMKRHIETNPNKLVRVSSLRSDGTQKLNTIFFEGGYGIEGKN
jgi:hypothetical protein